MAGSGVAFLGHSPSLALFQGVTLQLDGLAGDIWDRFPTAETSVLPKAFHSGDKASPPVTARLQHWEHGLQRALMVPLTLVVTGCGR